MNTRYLLLPLLLASTAVAAQSSVDSTDVFFRHLELNEVVVTGLTGQTRRTHSPAPISLMSARDLHAAASTNLIDAIARQPGVSQITTGSGISKPVVRGLGYNRIVTLADGVRQEGQQWGDEHGIEIDEHAVGSVEILKGPASLMYGSDAMAGVVIFHPAPLPALGEHEATASSGFQTNNGLFSYSLSASGNELGWVWRARWSQKLAHAYKNAQDGYVPGSQFREHAINALVGRNSPWGHTHLSLGYYHQTPGIVEGERDDATGQLLAEAPLKTYGKALPFQQVAHYKAVLDQLVYLGNGSLKAIVAYQQNRRQEYEESASDYDLFFRLHTATYDVRYTREDLAGWNLSVGVGGMWQRSENLGEEVLIPAYRLLDAGVFACVSRDFGPVHLEGGLRTDRRILHSYALVDDGEQRFSDFHRHFHGITGSLGAVWQLSTQWNMRLNVARGFRAPNLSELGSNGIHEGTQRYELGNANLKAEHSTQIDLGIDYSSTYVSAQLALFANRIGNYIYAQRILQTSSSPLPPASPLLPPASPLLPPVYQYTQGDALLSGLEATIDAHPMHRLHFENTFSYVNARQMHREKDSRYLPMTPPARWNSELKYELTHHGGSTLHSLRLCNAYVSLQMEATAAQHHCLRKDHTETPTAGYTLWHIGAGTDIHVGKQHVASLYLTVQNLFDHVYQSHLSRLKYTDVNPLTGKEGIANMGRNMVLRLEIPLKL